MKCMVPVCDKEATMVCPDQGPLCIELHFCEEDYAKHYHFDHIWQSALTPPGPRATLCVFDGENSYREWLERRGPFDAMR